LSLTENGGRDLAVGVTVAYEIGDPSLALAQRGKPAPASIAPGVPCRVMWSACAEPVDSPEAVALLRGYFAELTVRYFHRATTEQEIDDTLDEFPSTGLALFLVLRDDGAPAGCIGLHPTGEVTRMYVAARFRRRGGARVLLAAAESWARAHGIARLFLDTRTDLVEARAVYAACGFTEIPPPTATPGPFQDHWFEKPLVEVQDSST
jgi:GNAT superfamily N-acetyltransferase